MIYYIEYSIDKSLINIKEFMYINSFYDELNNGWWLIYSDYIMSNNDMKLFLTPENINKYLK